MIEPITPSVALLKIKLYALEVSSNECFNVVNSIVILEFQSLYTTH